MPTTRKKLIKTVYKDDDDSDADNVGDFSDSGSEAHISDNSGSSDDENIENEPSSADEFQQKPTIKGKRSLPKKQKFTKKFYNKINKQMSDEVQNEDVTTTRVLSAKDLSDADKLLPSVLNLSEDDSSDEDEVSTSKQSRPSTSGLGLSLTCNSEDETPTEYKDVWSNNIHDKSGEIAMQTFQQLQEHANRIEETKTTLKNYAIKESKEKASDVNDLLALGEEIIEPTTSGMIPKGRKKKKIKDNSDSDVDDWEEVQDSKPIPKQGIQLVVDFPDACRKPKTVDVEMMMRRKINRVKKEYQVYMHKVHVLCWLGHGNYVSQVLNDRDVLEAALSLVPSKTCYPGERVDLKYVQMIATWYKDKVTLKQDKNENKFKPKAPPLREILIAQIKSKVVTTKKFMVFIFVSVLRALGLQCRIMFNFVTLPLKPPASELCSLATKNKNEPTEISKEQKNKKQMKPVTKTTTKRKVDSKSITQLDGTADLENSSDDEFENFMQLDGSSDTKNKKVSSKSIKNKTTVQEESDDVSPPKRTKTTEKVEVNSVQSNTSKEETIPDKRKRITRKGQNLVKENLTNKNETIPEKSKRTTRKNHNSTSDKNMDKSQEKLVSEDLSSPNMKNRTGQTNNTEIKSQPTEEESRKIKNVAKVGSNIPKIVISDENEAKSSVSSKYFVKGNDSPNSEEKAQTSIRSSRLSLSRKRTYTEEPNEQKDIITKNKETTNKSRTKSAPATSVESKYFAASKRKSRRNENTNEYNQSDVKGTTTPVKQRIPRSKQAEDNDKLRVSHKDLANARKPKAHNDVTSDLVDIIKGRIKSAKADGKTKLVKGKVKDESDDDSDYLPVESVKHKAHSSDSEADFKPSTSSKVSRRPIDRRVLSSDEETSKNHNKVDVWCEIFVEELEQWISVDVIRARAHCSAELYSRATHPVCYVVGWDNNNNLKDLTRRYVPHWNTVTRKQRVESPWWEHALRPWRGLSTPRDREEDEYLDKMQLEAPLPKSIAEYKNHPLYVLKRHLLKFEVIYPADAATLGFVRGEAVYARDCVYVCRSRDTWLKEAKVVRLGEKPYKIVKARPKWDKLSNKVITDKPLEIFGPWQVQEYEPPVAENGIVPRNAYGNVELFKLCMLPKGTVHIKLPGLQKVAKKLNIDCAPAMTGFDFNGGWTHPVFDGFVVCKEFEEIISSAWEQEQEEQERREREKIETRVYGHWKKLIRGLLIRERLQLKYGFEAPTSSNDAKSKPKRPKFVVKKRT